MVPYDRCARWRWHERYFATRGLAPWLEGEVPHQATSNYAFARAHALLLLALVRAVGAHDRLGPSEALPVLELGGGLGSFAGNFLGALRDDLGEDGRRAFARVTYTFSDSSPTVVAEATVGPDLSPFVADGTLVPLLFDARDPASTRRGSLPTPQPVLVVANYLCCVLAPKVLRKTPEGWRELYAPSQATEAGAPQASGGWQAIVGPHEWRPVPLERLWGDSAHRLALERAMGDARGAEVAYPQAFLDLMDAVAEALRPGGLFLFSDFADESYEVGFGPAERTPVLYGDSLAHPVCFPAVRAFAETRGYRFLESRGGHGALRTVLLSAAPVPEPVRARFEAFFIDRSASQDLLDFASAAKALGRSGDPYGALRFWDRCLDLAPHDPLLYLRAGEEALAAGDYESAASYFRRGVAADGPGVYDFECRIAETYALTNQPRRALSYLEASLQRGEKAGKYVLLGDAEAALGEHERACRAYRRALELEPGQPKAVEGLELIASS